MKKITVCLAMLFIIAMPVMASGADPPIEFVDATEIVAIPTLEPPTSPTNEVVVSWVDQGIVPTTLARESFVLSYSHSAVIASTDVNEGLEVAIGAYTKPADVREMEYLEIDTPRTWDVDLRRT